MVPATSASSTIESLLSLSASSSIGSMNAIMPRSTRSAREGSYGSDELRELAPGAHLLAERARIGGARGRQVDERDVRRRGANQPAADPGRRRAVERNR